MTITPQERAQWARERRSLEGSLITQEGTFAGAMIVEHVRGSQYLIELKNGERIFASHKKQKDQRSRLSFNGWTIWKEKD